VTFHYRLIVENYKDTPAEVRSYRPRGILRWDVEVPARAVGAKAFTVEYTYKMSHDRNLVPTGLTGGAAEAAARKEFEQMKQRR